MLRDQLLKELCMEIANGDVRGFRFNELLLESGITLDDNEWDAANRLLGRSEEMLSCYDSMQRTIQ